MTRPPLVLTGGPAVGKTTTARTLAAARDRCAVVDVDDVRQLVLSGHVPPWAGAEGDEQRLLGVTNACALARNFVEAGFDVVVADVLTPTTVARYRSLLEGCYVVRLVVPVEEARRRATTRPPWLSDEEFDALHAADPPAGDAEILVEHLDEAEQAAAVEDLWAKA